MNASGLTFLNQQLEHISKQPRSSAQAGAPANTRGVLPEATLVSDVLAMDIECRELNMERSTSACLTCEVDSTIMHLHGTEGHG